MVKKFLVGNMLSLLSIYVDSPKHMGATQTPRKIFVLLAVFANKPTSAMEQSCAGALLYNGKFK